MLLLFCTLALFFTLPTHATTVDSYTKLLLPMDGGDGSTTISDSTGKTVTNPENCLLLINIIMTADVKEMDNVVR
ncbi:MAG: hypothetical protein HY754_01805 [Nitrospirae bacterium]|nr:hypothetical protein [Nitrospirota bacterium]